MRRAGGAAAAAVCAALLVPAAATATYGGHAVPRARAVSLAHFTVARGGGQGECTGVVIAPLQVLTAAHCVRSRRPDERVRVLGRTLRAGNPGRSARTARITRVVVHPRYRSRVPQDGFDLAVLSLSRPVGPPVPLATPADEAALAAPGAQVTATGFGATATAPDATDGRAHAVTLAVRDPRACVVATLVDAFARSQMCAGADTRGVCPGDSGGPLTGPGPDGRTRVVGITARTMPAGGCGTASTGVFSRVAPFRTWILAQTGPLGGDAPPPAPPG